MDEYDDTDDAAYSEADLVTAATLARLEAERAGVRTLIAFAAAEGLSAASVLKALSGTGAAVVEKAAAHAPKGGVSVQGKDYTGGEFIPADVMARATDEEKAAVEGGAKAPLATAESERESPESAPASDVGGEYKEAAAQLVSGSNLPEDLAAEYTRALAHVLGKLPPASVKYALGALKSYGKATFHADLASVKKAYGRVPTRAVSTART